jgi:MraZ protein
MWTMVGSCGDKWLVWDADALNRDLSVTTRIENARRIARSVANHFSASPATSDLLPDPPDLLNGMWTVFLGRFEHTLDAKGRLAIPARFRAGLGDGLVITRGIDRCLTVYPIAVWQELAERIAGLSLADADARQFQRMVFSEASDAILDGQGRIVVSADLRAYAGIEREAIVIGLHTSCEIWSPKRWNEIQARAEEGVIDIAARLADLL